ncbi:MAG: DUF4065 domain-containing protein [Actinobacteria bacterium]|nr:DUF4065 domain-containing protein [Actinomycetota bacterium]
MPRQAGYTVHDIAAAILAKTGPISAMKFQKLVFYAQATHLAAHHTPLFEDRIEAWAQGPVVRSLYNQHRGSYSVADWPNGDPTQLSEQAQRSVDETVARYGHLSAANLSALSHRELPWRAARGNLAPNLRSDNPIPISLSESFYSHHGGMTEHALRNVVANAVLEGVEPSEAAQKLAAQVLAGRNADEAVAAFLEHATG